MHEEVGADQIVITSESTYDMPATGTNSGTFDTTTPVVVTTVTEEISDRDLSRYATLIYERTGIRISPQKKSLLSNRLRRRIRATGARNYADYYERLQRLPPADPEWNAFLQEITTHETYLFRDESQWNWFRNEYLPELGARTNEGRGATPLRIWSAACSTGDEAFTAAACIADCQTSTPSLRVHILGTDIGTGALEQAKSATFGERAMRLVPDSYRKRFFRKSAQAPTWEATPALKSMVTFRQHNLLSPLRDGPFDLVFLKNVLIYFSAESKRRVVDHVRSVIRPGGLLVAGPAEGISDLVRDYRRLRPWLCQRPTQ